MTASKSNGNTEQPTDLVPMHVATGSLLNIPALMSMACLPQHQRNINRCVEEAIALVTLDRDTAVSCFYSVPRGGKQIVGPSIGLAETLVATWRNLCVSVDSVEIGEREVTVRGWIVDTQTGSATQDFVRQSIMYSGKGARAGDRFDDDMINVRIAASRSILYRNLVFRMVPRPMVNRIFSAARSIALGGADSFEARQKKVVKFWVDKGIQQGRLLQHLGHTAIEQISLMDIDYLLGIEQAIRLGDTTMDEVFTPPAETPEPPAKTVETVKRSAAQRKAAQQQQNTPEHKMEMEMEAKTEPEPDPEPEPETSAQKATGRKTRPADATKTFGF